MDVSKVITEKDGLKVRVKEIECLFILKSSTRCVSQIVGCEWISLFYKWDFFLVELFKTKQ